MPIDPTDLNFKAANLSYEGTVLFMVANFQYLATCMSFSIAKPFRKEIWTNYPFLFCVIFIFSFNILVLFLPSKSYVSTEFDLLAFVAKDGTSYYIYKYWIALGIALNSILTYVSEKTIVNIYTRRYDAKMKLAKQEKFLVEMAGYRNLAKEEEHLLLD